jgi:hypothetical protein
VLDFVSHGSRRPADAGRIQLAGALVKMLMRMPYRRQFSQRLWYHYIRGRRTAARARLPRRSLHTDSRSMTDP